MRGHGRRAISAAEVNSDWLKGNLMDGFFRLTAELGTQEVDSKLVPLRYQPVMARVLQRSQEDVPQAVSEDEYHLYFWLMKKQPWSKMENRTMAVLLKTAYYRLDVILSEELGIEKSPPIASKKRAAHQVFSGQDASDQQGEIIEIKTVTRDATGREGEPGAKPKGQKQARRAIGSDFTSGGVTL